MQLITAAGISEAWLSALRYLDNNGREAWDLAVEMLDPQAAENPQIRSQLDSELARRGLQTVETVAATIFPESIWRTSQGDRDRFYERYLRINRKMRRFPGNHHGTYFERLIRWPPGVNSTNNQLESVIKRMHREFRDGGSRLRVVYDLAIFSPGNDTRPLGFPCLSYLNVKVEDGRVRLTAHYRNHWFIERAYGNYLGLTRLQRFIAAQANLGVGELICISGHAEVDKSPTRLLASIAHE
jgi:thymidylate synthase